MMRLGLIVGPKPPFLELMKMKDLLVEKGLWLEHRLPRLLDFGLLIRCLIRLLDSLPVLVVRELIEVLGHVGILGF